MRGLFSTLSALACVFVAASPAAARNVYFVDNARTAGPAVGSFEKPFTTLAQAASVSHDGDVIYVADGNAPYDGSILLKRGQLLIGSAYGLDAVAVDLKEVLSAPPTPAVQGPGPTIHGGVWLSGDNVVAGFTIAAESGSAIGASAPSGPITVRKTYIRTAARATALYLAQCSFPITIDGGGIEASAFGSGISIDGGIAAITFDRFPVTGSFTSAIAISNRGGGAVKFRNGSKIAIDDARNAIVISNSKGPIAFEMPVAIATRGGRGLVVTSSGPVVFSGGASRIATTNGAALEVHDARLTATFDRVSAEGVAPGVLNEGIVIDKLTGKISVTGQDGKAGSGGTIRKARLYGIRITQSADVRLSSIDIADSGSASAECPEDLDRKSNVRCAAGLYLRHVARSHLDDIAITGGGASGLTANNVRDVVFEGLHVSGNGTDAKDPSVLIQEAGGTITFNRCRLTDGAGGGIVAEQRFNAGRLVFEHCEISAPNRPSAAPYLVRVQTVGDGKLQLAFNALQLRDSAGSAFSASASDSSTLSLAIVDSYAEHLGGSFVDIAARQPTHVAFSLRGTRVAAPGSVGRPLISIEGGDDPADAFDACIDIAGNTLTFGGGAPAIRVRAPHAKVNVVGAGSGGDAPAVAALLGRNNDGASAAVETGRPVALVGACQ
jgi:hypothetical protein